MASGDPHYKTYDGQWIHFMGECMYTLSKSTIEDDECAFNVEVKNEHRRGKQTVTYTRMVDLEMLGHTIRLKQNRKIEVKY